jgi:hypothetical protein
VRVAFLHHNPGGYIGGAELTMREFATRKPSGVTVVWPTPVDVLPKVDKIVVGNWQGERPAGFRYVHDMRGGIEPGDTAIFCSPLQKEKYGLPGHVIPPALNLGAFRRPRERRKEKREGTVAIGQWRNPGKGQRYLTEWSEVHEPVTVYGGGPFVPAGPNLEYGGELDPSAVPEVLWKAECFVHIPTDIEPFGRAVAEAWAAGVPRIVTNNRVGAAHYIENDQAALRTAAADFWELICAPRSGG